MFVLRVWGSAITHKSPDCDDGGQRRPQRARALLAGLARQVARARAVALLAATLFGVGKTFLWPTMIGITAEQFPRGGALADVADGGRRLPCRSP